MYGVLEWPIKVKIHGEYVGLQHVGYNLCEALVLQVQKDSYQVYPPDHPVHLIVQPVKPSLLDMAAIINRVNSVFMTRFLPSPSYFQIDIETITYKHGYDCNHSNGKKCRKTFCTRSFEVILNNKTGAQLLC